MYHTIKVLVSGKVHKSLELKRRSIKRPCQASPSHRLSTTSIPSRQPIYQCFHLSSAEIDCSFLQNRIHTQQGQQESGFVLGSFYVLYYTNTSPKHLWEFPSRRPPPGLLSTTSGVVPSSKLQRRYLMTHLLSGVMYIVVTLLERHFPVYHECAV